ncbi:MAG: hypothetical protein K0Q59_3425 [Paenibacillus sp.]|nr:hypothetical protein [Paenibacillus sp.]
MKMRSIKEIPSMMLKAARWSFMEIAWQGFWELLKP